MATKLKKFSENYFPYAGWVGNNGDFYFSLVRGTDEHIKENILKRGGKLIGIEHIPASLTWKERGEAAEAAKAKFHEQYEQMTEHKNFSVGQVIHLKFKNGVTDFVVKRPATQKDLKEWGGCDAKVDFTCGGDWGVGEDWQYMFLEGVKHKYPAIVAYKGKWQDTWDGTPESIKKPESKEQPSDATIGRVRCWLEDGKADIVVKEGDKKNWVEVSINKDGTITGPYRSVNRQERATVEKIVGKNIFEVHPKEEYMDYGDGEYEYNG